jgi:RNA polymerase sigma-70 factor (ECF subfamily)
MRRWLLAGNGTCGGHVVTVPVTANGSPVCAVYVPVGPDSRHEPFALHVLDLSHDRIRTIHAYLDPSLFPQFGLPTVLVP